MTRKTKERIAAWGAFLPSFALWMAAWWDVTDYMGDNVGLRLAGGVAWFALLGVWMAWFPWMVLAYCLGLLDPEDSKTGGEQ